MIARAMFQVQKTSIDLKASKEIDENLEMIKEERVAGIEKTETCDFL